MRMPPTQWKIASHNASENGTTLLTTVIGEKRFPFPKSLYAVRDTLRFLLQRILTHLSLTFLLAVAQRFMQSTYSMQKMVAIAVA